MFTIGTDPEFILTDKNKFVSAISKFPSPSQPITKNKNKFYYDNVMVEIQIKEAKDKKEFITNIGSAIYDLSKLAFPLEISPNSSCVFDEDQLKHPDARVIGCNAEYCAYELRILSQPHNIIKNTGFRSAGGHIHLGSKSLCENGYDIIHVTRSLDLFLGIPSLFLDKTTGNKDRRKIYGKAGSHRITDYGLEYRPLSNFWLFSPELCGFVYEICDFVLEFVKTKKYLELWKVDQKILEKSDDPSKAYFCTAYNIEDFRSCIDASDKLKAKHFLKIVKKYLPSDIFTQIKQLAKTNLDLKSNWGLS